MRGLNLSSPSVSYRHLQKLENLGLITKNQNGNYILAKKIGIKGYVWIGKKLISYSLFYFIFFLTIFVLELIVFVIHVLVETDQFKIFFFLLMTVTIVALILFLIEGLRTNKKLT